MEDIQKILVKLENGNEVEANVLTFLKDEQTGKEYVLYTLDETTDTVDVCASIFVEKDGEYELQPIEDDAEWKKLQNEIATLADE